MDQILHQNLTAAALGGKDPIKTAIKVAERDSWIDWTHTKPGVVDHSPSPTLPH